MIFYDTETCGLHGIIVLIQWAEDEGPIHLHDVWYEPIEKTQNLIRKFMQDTVVGFNLVFDHFHLCKLYNIFRHLDQTWIPIEHVQEILAQERVSYNNALALNPEGVCDLMLHARKGPHQSLMDRKDIYIRKLPLAIAHSVASALNEKIRLPEIYFARRHENRGVWQVEPKDQHFADIVLRFAPKGGLKALVSHEFGLETKTFDDVTDLAQPDIPGWNPVGGWGKYIKIHARYWKNNTQARTYAYDDVKYTRMLFHRFDPVLNDNDSILTVAVANCRWKGFTVDLTKLEDLKNTAMTQMQAPMDSRRAWAYLEPYLSLEESIILDGSTKKELLKELVEQKSPAADAAAAILAARGAKKRLEVINKLLRAGIFHASFRIIGTLSSRMSGGDGLNPQAMQRTKDFRKCFTFAPEGYELWGGDFDAFEVTLADAVYKDKKLHEALLAGKSIHGLFGTLLFPGNSYDDIIKSKGSVDDLYEKSKRSLFGILYGGNAHTLKKKVGVNLEQAEEAYHTFGTEYPGVGDSRQRVINMFSALRQEAGIGSRIVYSKPRDYIESLTKFPRYFTLENQIVKALYDLANNPPQEWKSYTGKVTRREGRIQTECGAAQTAIYAAAFNQQGRIIRAAANHEIQSSGATITKHVQRAVWDVQPKGIGEFVVMPFNCHDEILTPVLPDKAQLVKQKVESVVESYREMVPLISLEWKRMQSWAEK